MPKQHHQTTISRNETKEIKSRFLNLKEEFSEVLIDFCPQEGSVFLQTHWTVMTIL
jgi:hypothetical protein